jgi:nitrate/nitrite-specific signal transduction histidine kinase
MDLPHYLDAMERLQGVAADLSRDAPHPYDRQAHHYQQMLDVIGASLVEWGHPSLTEEEQARLIAASESAELAHRSHAQSLHFVKVAIDILHPRMPKPKNTMNEQP